jgi:hypothetical protein
MPPFRADNPTLKPPPRRSPEHPTPRSETVIQYSSTSHWSWYRLRREPWVVGHDSTDGQPGWGRPRRPAKAATPGNMPGSAEHARAPDHTGPPVRALTLGDEQPRSLHHRQVHQPLRGQHPPGPGPIGHGSHSPRTSNNTVIDASGSANTQHSSARPSSTIRSPSRHTTRCPDPPCTSQTAGISIRGSLMTARTSGSLHEHNPGSTGGRRLRHPARCTLAHHKQPLTCSGSPAGTSPQQVTGEQRLTADQRS